MSEPTNTELIAEAVRLSEAATLGPWTHNLDPMYEGVSYEVNRDLEFFGHQTEDVAAGMIEEDAEFIARSRTLVPELAAALEQAGKELADEVRFSDRTLDAKNDRIAELEQKLSEQTATIEAATAALDQLPDGGLRVFTDIRELNRKRVSDALVILASTPTTEAANGWESVDTTGSPTLAAGKAAARFGIILSSIGYAYIAEAVLAASGLRDTAEAVKLDPEELADFIEAASTEWEADFRASRGHGPKADFIAQLTLANFTVTRAAAKLPKKGEN